MDASPLEGAGQEKSENGFCRGASLAFGPAAGVAESLAGQPCRGQYSFRAELRHDLRQGQRGPVLRPIGELSEVFRFALVIEFGLDRGTDLLAVRRHVEAASQVTDWRSEPAEGAEVQADLFRDLGILHFDGDFPSVVQRSAVHLADRCRDSLGIDGAKAVLRGPAKLMFDGRERFLCWQCRGILSQAGEGWIALVEFREGEQLANLLGHPVHQPDTVHDASQNPIAVGASLATFGGRQIPREQSELSGAFELDAHGFPVRCRVPGRSSAAMSQVE